MLLPRSVPQIVTALAANMIMLATGFHFGWTSPSLPQLLSVDSEVRVTPYEGSWIVSMLQIGTLTGTWLAALTMDRFGRKTTLLLAVVPYTLSGLAILFAQEYWWYLVSRVFAGLGVGMVYNTLALYTAEIAEVEIRGRLVIVVYNLLSVGLLLVFSIGAWYSMRTVAMIGTALPLMYAVIFVWFPESPYFYAMVGKPEEARRSLVRLRGTEDVDDELKEVEKSVAFDLRNPGTYRELFTAPGIRKALIIGIGLYVSLELNGRSTILAYSTIIFRESDVLLSPNVSVIVMGLVQFISGFLSTIMVDWYGRRPLLIYSTAATVVSLAGEALYFQLRDGGIDVSPLSWLPLIGIVGFEIFSTVGLGCVTDVVIAEIFPCNLKGKALIPATAAFTLTALTVSQLFEIIDQLYGIQYVFWFLSITTTFSVIFMYHYLPETKQRSFHDIQNELQNVTNSKNPKGSQDHSEERVRRIS